ncbi:MAG: PEP-CTERM sorting domain-containing protein [Myxococcota bacterium]
MQLDGALTPFRVDVGVNVITGGFSCFGFGCSDPADVFRIEVPLGLEVTNTELFVAPVEFGVHLFRLAPTGTTAFIFNDFVGTPPFNITSTLGAGIYDASVLRSGAGSWRWSFTAAAVPEPASLTLLLAGLAGLGFLKRRTRQA